MPTPFRRGLRSGAVLLWGVPLLYASWLGMMAVHELGHVLHAWVSGATVLAVRIPLLGFSITELGMNPRPHFVAWGGVVWGCALPLAVWALFVTRRWRGWRLLQFFTGFCLVANGAYLGAGWVDDAGDAGDLLAYGAPVWVRLAVGVVAAAAGLYLWHGLEVVPAAGAAPADPASET